MERIVAAKPLSGNRLWLRFTDGAEGEVDLSSLVGQGVFASWRDPAEFATGDRPGVTRVRCGRAVLRTEPGGYLEGCRMAIVTDTVQGTIGTGPGEMWFHYDIGGDVLYLRLASQREIETVSEETPDGLLLLRRADDDRPVGMTVVDWWKRFGAGSRPDSLRELESTIEPWATRLAA